MNEGNCLYCIYRENLLQHYCTKNKDKAFLNIDSCVYWKRRPDDDGHTIDGQTKVFDDACILSVKGMTNTPQGGDTGHGGKMEFEFINHASMDGHVYVNGKEVPLFGTLTIKLYGDAEARVMQKALSWLAKHFKEQIENNERYR